jgi:hypothetical protein
LTGRRQLAVIVGPQGGAGERFEIQPGARGAFSMSVTATYDASGEPAKATLTLINPPRDLPSALRSSRGFLRVEAGYGTAGVVFAGSTLREGLEYTYDDGDDVLKLKALSGGRAYREARVRSTLTEVPSFERLVRDSIAAGGWRVGTLDLDHAPRDLPRGIAASGDVWRLLERLARMSRTNLVVTEDSVSLLRFDARRLGNLREVPRFTSDNGSLIGIPSETFEGIDYRAYLTDPTHRVGSVAVLRYPDPWYAPGRRRDLPDGNDLVERRVVAKQVTFDLDSRGDAFHMNVKGRIVRG